MDGLPFRYGQKASSNVSGETQPVVLVPRLLSKILCVRLECLVPKKEIAGIIGFVSADNVFVESFKTHLEHLDSDTMVTPSLGDIVTDSIIFHRWNHVISNIHHHDQIPSKNSIFHFNDFLISLARSIPLYYFRNNQRKEIFENFS